MLRAWAATTTGAATGTAAAAAAAAALPRIIFALIDRQTQACNSEALMPNGKRRIHAMLLGGSIPAALKRTCIALLRGQWGRFAARENTLSIRRIFHASSFTVCPQRHRDTDTAAT